MLRLGGGPARLLLELWQAQAQSSCCALRDTMNPSRYRAMGAAISPVTSFNRAV